MRLLDLFSGIGGFSLAFERAGFHTAAFSEVEPFPNRVLNHHWSGTTNLGDVTKWSEWNWSEIGDVDIVSFGSPCQDLSVAGKRAGLSGERSGLFHDAVAAVRRSGARFALWENVPGAMYCNGGRDFGAVLDALADAGAMDVAWRVLDAQYFGVPQRRRRIFLVADFGGERAAEVLFEPEGVRGRSETRKEEGKSVAALTAGGVGTCGADDNQGAAGHLLTAPTLTGNGDAHSGFKDERGLVAPALTSRYGKGADSDANGVIAQGFSNRGTDTGSVAETLRYDPHAPTIALQYATSHREKRQNGTGIAEPGDPMYTLDTFANHAVAAFCAGNSEGAGSIGYEPERSPTLRGAASGTNMTPTVIYPEDVSLQQHRYNALGGDSSAETGETHTREILRMVRETVGEEAFEEWSIGVLASLWPEEVLRANVHGPELRRKGDNGRPELDDGSLPREEAGSKGAMSEVRQAGCERRTPLRWKLDEQLDYQLGAYLSGLSHQATQIAFVRYLRRTSQSLRLLRQALSEMEKVWRSTDGEAEPAHGGPQRRLVNADTRGGDLGGMAVRRLTPL